MIKVEVLETIPELKELLRLTKHLKVKDRILVLYWIKSNQVKTKEAQLWLMQEHGIEISYTAVHHLIRYQLKQKLNISTTELRKPKLTRKKNEKISPKILSSSIKQQSFN